MRKTILLKICYADINCRFKTKWSNEIDEDSFLKNIEDLKRLMEEEV